MTNKQRLEAEIKRLREEVAYYKKEYEHQRIRYMLVIEAWSRVHPVDLAFMHEREGKTAIPDVYNHLLYDFGRPDPDGTTRTRLSSIWL